MAQGDDLISGTFPIEVVDQRCNLTPAAVHQIHTHTPKMCVFIK